MKINEVIRKYRKEQNLTQEQIANYLGVTAPAVNKWEKGISYPDITLLAPLSRVLGIDPDKLLSFREELTDSEIDHLLKAVSEKIRDNSYEQGFEQGEKLIREYPNCDKLILSTAQILNAFLKIKDIENAESFERKIIGWYEMTATSRQQAIASQAIAALVTFYMSKEKYDKAQQLLDKIPEPGYDKQLVQAMLFTNQGKHAQAYEIYEQMLFKGANEISSILQITVHLLCKEKEFETASRYADMGRTMAELFDLGAYNACIAPLFLEIEKKDKEKSIMMLEQMIDGMDTMTGYQHSALYTHMKFNEGSHLGNIREMLKRGLESDKQLDFIRDEPRFKRMVKRLDM